MIHKNILYDIQLVYINSHGYVYQYKQRYK